MFYMFFLFFFMIMRLVWGVLLSWPKFFLFVDVRFFLLRHNIISFQATKFHRKTR